MKMFHFLLKSEFRINFSVEEYVSLYTINIFVFIPVTSLLFLMEGEVLASGCAEATQKSQHSPGSATYGLGECEPQCLHQ